MKLTEILEKCTIEGNSIRLPQVQLDRKDFTDLQKALIKAGAKKVTGKDFRFDFPVAAQSIIDQLLGGEKIDIKKEFQFFETPKELAQRMITLAEIETGNYVLEPSAGQGAILDLLPQDLDYYLYLYELNPLNRDVLRKKSYMNTGDDFLQCGYKNYFDKIIANPPFSKNQDIDHVLKMFDTLDFGGRIITVMSNHWRFCEGKKETNFKEWLQTIDHEIIEIEAGTFKESGTQIATCLLIINK